jgi:hypothetical protein
VVGPDAIGPAEIQNISRSISLPLASFVNDTDGATLNFTPSNGTSPDLAIAGGNLVIEWDDDSDGGGGDVADTDFVRSNFAIPPDYAGGGVFTIHFTKDAHSGVAERFDCQVGLNGFLGPHSTTDAFAAGPAAVSMVLVPPNPYVSGPPVNVRCAVQDSSGGNTANDIVRVSGIDFMYGAKQ